MNILKPLVASAIVLAVAVAVFIDTAADDAPISAVCLDELEQCVEVNLRTALSSLAKQRAVALKATAVATECVDALQVIAAELKECQAR